MKSKGKDKIKLTPHDLCLVRQKQPAPSIPALCLLVLLAAVPAKLVRWGKLPVSLQGVIGYWAESSATGPESWRFRLQANFVLPK
jgi:hypothetical protein